MKKINTMLLASAGLVALVTGASAAAVNWSDGASSWFTATNWSTNTVPATGDTVTVSNGGTSRIDLGRATANIASLSINGGSTVDVQGGGTLNTGAINLGNGATVGTLLLSGSSNIGAGAIAMNNGALTINLNGGAISNAISLTGSTNTITATSAGSSFFLQGVISGTGGLFISGPGQVTVTANETYTGGTTINPGGTLSLGQGTANGSVVGNITDNGTLSLNHNAPFTVGNLITGTGILNSVGTNTLTNNDTYSSSTIIQTGTLFLSGSGAISNSSSVQFSGAHAASFDASAITASTFSLKSIDTCLNCTLTDTSRIAGGTINLGAKSLILTNASGTYLGAIIGTGGITVQSGTEILGGANTYSGGTSISSAAATLQIGTGGTTGSIVGNVTDNGTLTFNRSDAVTFAGVISGTGALTQSGTGTLILSAVNTYTGSTTISAGTLALTGTGGVGSSLIIDNSIFDISGTTSGASIKSLNGSGTVALGTKSLTLTNASSVFSGAITGSGGVTLSGSETLSGNNTYTGGTTINAGAILQIGSGGTTGAIPGNVTDNGTLRFNRSDAVTFAGVVSGSGTLQQSGTGVLTLTGVNTFTGTAVVSTGSLALTGAGSVASASNMLVNGIFDISGTTSGASVRTLSGSGSVVLGSQNLTINGTSAATFTGVISGAGSLTVSGSARETLLGTNTYTGGTTINAGATLFVASGSPQGTVAGNIVNNGLLNVNHGVATSAQVTYNGIISGTGNVIWAGNNVLTAAQTYTGITSQNSASLILSGTGSISNSSSLELSGFRQANFDISGVSGGGTSIVSLASCGNDRGVTCSSGDTTSLPGSTVTLGSNTLTLTNASGNFLGTITGTGGLVVAGGTEILSNDSSFTGGTTINAGATLQLGNGGTSGGVVGNITDNGTLIVNHSNDINPSGVVSGSGALVQAGNDVLALAGASTYTGGTTISAGTLQIGTGGTTGSIVGDVVDNATLAFNHTDDIVFSGNVSGTGGINQLGTGNVFLTGNVTTTGPTVISAGALVIGAGGTAGSITSDVTDNAILAFSRSDTITYAGAISGTGGVVQAGTGTVILTGTNSYTGGTTINAGASLQVGNGSTTGTLPGDVTDNGTLAFNRSDDITYGGVISGTGNVVQLGPDNLTLTGTGSYTGTTTVAGGTLTVTGSIAGSNATVQSGATLTGSGAFGAVTVQRGGIFSNSGTGSSTTVGGTFTNSGTTGATTVQSGGVFSNSGTAGSVTVLGTFSGTGTAGATTVQSGGLLTSTGSLGSTTVQGGGTLSVAGSGTTGTLTVSGLTLNSGSIFNADVTSSGADKVVDTGTATIGGILNASFATTGSYAATQYTLVAATGPLSGTFSNVNLTNIPVNFSSSVTYDARNVFLNLATLSSSGTATVDSGTTTVSGSQTTGGLSSTGSGGTVNLTSGSTLTDNQNSNTTFFGTITGPGSFAKTGTGTLILDGTNTFTGGTTIGGGTLEIGDITHKGATILGPVSVGSGGTLQGHGTINGAVTIGSGGTLQPGGTIGTITVGSASFASGSTYSVETSATQADLLTATGAVSISSGAKLAVIEDAPLSAYARTTNFTIVQAAGGVSGTFSTVTSSSATFLPSVTYSSNAVSLTLLRTDLAAGLATNANQANAAAAVIAGGTSALSSPLAAMSDAGVQAAYGQLSGDIHASLRGAAVEDSRIIRDAVLDHLNAPGAGTTLWAVGFGGYGSIATDGNASGLHHNSAGFVGGADMDVGSGFRLGVGGAYSSNSASTTGRASTASGDVGHVLAYAGWSNDAVDLKLGGDLGWGTTSVARTVSAYSQTDSDRQDQRLSQVFGEFGFRIPGTPIVPYADVASISATTGAFTETGGSAALSGGEKTDTQTYSNLGLRFSIPMDWIVPRFDVAWQHAFNQFLPTQTQTLQAVSQSFTVLGAPLVRDAAAVRAGFAFTIAPDASLSLDYDGSVGGRVQNNAIRGGFEWRF